MSLQTYLASARKAELHVHLEGSIRPVTLLKLAQNNGIALPANTVEGLRQWFVFRDFNHFIEVYVVISSCLRTAEDFELITHEFGAEMARQNCRYAEVTFTPSSHHHRGVPDNIYLDGLARGREKARAEFGVEINWVFDINRNVDDPAKRHHYADYTARIAAENIASGVVALGLGGAEVDYPPEPFEPYFTGAKASGLHSDPHAGETTGPESVWGALRALGAERIGHGVRSVEDPTLIAYLVEQRIPLEVNPTSNIRLGIYPDLAAHPLRRLHDAGVLLTVNSDDPALFNTTLNNEVATLTEPFGFDVATIDEILLNGIRHSFMPAERKQQLETAFRQELDVLKAKHLTC